MFIQNVFFGGMAFALVELVTGGMFGGLWGGGIGLGYGGERGSLHSKLYGITLNFVVS